MFSGIAYSGSTKSASAPRKTRVDRNSTTGCMARATSTAIVCGGPKRATAPVLTLFGGQLDEVIARLGDDPLRAAAGHSVERKLRSQVEEVALDHATTVFIVSENCFHCPLSFASSARPRLVSRYIRRRRPAATVHSLASSPPDSSR